MEAWRWPEMRREEPDLVVLDLMLPGMDGLDICRWMRRHDKFAGTPILMLTARAEEADRIVGLELGADDYVNQAFQRARSCRPRPRLAAPRREPIPQAAMLQTGRPFDRSLRPFRERRRPAGGIECARVRLLHFMAPIRAWSFTGPGAGSRVGQ